MLWFVIPFIGVLVVVIVGWGGTLLRSFAFDLESLKLRRARRQVSANRTPCRLSEVVTAFRCVNTAKKRLDDSYTSLSGMGISHKHRARLYVSLQAEIVDLEAHLAVAVCTTDFRAECLDAALQEASVRGIDVSDATVVTFEMVVAAWLVKPCISLYLPLITVASRPNSIVVQAPDWFYQLVQHTLDSQPHAEPVVSGVSNDAWMTKVYQRSFAVSAEVLAAAIVLWEPGSRGVYSHFSAAISAAKALH